jgi:nucleoid DNA-binding protein
MPPGLGELNLKLASSSMKRDELTRKLAREDGLPVAVAQDRIDELVHRIVTKLRRGRPVELPGIETLIKRAGTHKQR